jgi:NAD(P)-dependent dehydrogenase (short-subunit alcohol dehydrogenase family)
MSAPSVWLITGASRGLGFEIAKAALKAGHVVVAGRRGYKPTTQITELESLGARWINLDMKLSNIESIIAGVEKEYGHIDVLVNNAGYGVGGTVEDLRFVLSLK